MAPHLDTSDFSEQIQQGPHAARFFGLLDRICRKISVIKEDGYGDNGKAAITQLITEQLASIQDSDDREVFFQRAHDVFTAFFGIEYLSADEVMPQIIDLVRKIHGDVAAHVSLDEVSSVRALQDRVVNAQNTIVDRARRNVFDVATFLGGLFGDRSVVAREDVQRYIEEHQQEMPPRVLESLEKFLRGFKGKEVARQMIKGMMNSTLSGSALSSGEQVAVQRLSSLNLFLESLKSPSDVSDFFAHLFLRGSISYEEAQGLLHHTPSTLPAEILYSAFNGKVLLDDPFVQLRSREAIAQALIDSMYASDFIQIVGLLMDVASNKTSVEEICLRTGVGGTPDPMPVRLASYILCSLKVAQRFLEKFGASPKIEFFTGQEGAIACNDVDAQTVRDNTADAFSFVQSFIHRFFPDIEGSFSLVQDREWESNPRIVMLVDYLEQLLLDAAKSDTVLTNIIDQLENRAKHHDGRDGRSALRYAAFHLLCFRDIPALNRYVEGSEYRRPEHVISVGGAAEREFDYVRALLVERFNVQDFNAYATSRGESDLSLIDEMPALKTRASIITGTGILPPYYAANPEGDVLIRQLKEVSDETRGFVGDRVHLAMSLSRPGEDSGAIGRARSVVRGMVLVASVAPPDQLYSFVADYNARGQQTTSLS